MPTGTTPADALVARELSGLLTRLARRRDVHHVTLGATPLDGSWTWRDATGVADPRGTPMTPDTPWMIASITKLFIASVILRLAERGQLTLDGPLREYLPDEFGHRLHVLDGVDRTGELTIAHLLGHLSGLPDYLDQRPADGPSFMEDVLGGPDRGWSPEDAVRHARDRLRPHFPPSNPRSDRPRIRYSDTNYQLLMVAAQHLTGRPIDRLLRELLLEPLGLAHTTRPGARPSDDGAAAVPEPATTWLGDLPFEHRPMALASFGDLHSTTDDLLRFGRALATGALFDDPATACRLTERFHRFGLPRSVATLRAPSWPIEYGLGVMRFALPRALALGRRLPHVVGHTGSTGSWLWFAPDLSLLVTGTVDQAGAAAVPFQTVPRALAAIARAANP